MLSAPIPATKHALEKAGMDLDDIDLVEINEAFASVVLAWQKDIGADHAKVNVERRRHRPRSPARRHRRPADDDACSTSSSAPAAATACRRCARAAARPTSPSSNGCRRPECAVEMGVLAPTTPPGSDRRLDGALLAHWSVLMPARRLVLASASPARRRLLVEAGFDPEVVVSGVDEASIAAASLPELVVALAEAKADAVASRPEVAGAVVVACDSLLDVDGEVHGKPASVEEARLA